MDDLQRKLYRLIWSRTLSTQMVPAKLEKTIVSIEADKPNTLFKAEGEVLIFDGFLKVYQESHDDEEVDDDKVLLPSVKVNEKLISEIKENLKTIEKEFDNQKIFDKVEKIILNLAKTKKWISSIESY